MASRPKTLPAGLSPVLVGTALADNHHTLHVLRFFAALVGALLIQVGANLSNDYSDAHRGTDTEDRLGPVRVTAGGLVPPRQVLIATYVTFGFAMLIGIYLIVVAGWQLLLIGVASIAAGVLYTGGPRPYGYEGLGEVFVFLFFGIVAVAGSFFVQTRHVDWASIALAIPVGLLPTAILVVNNTRDMDTDRRAGKKTLAVRMGRENSRRFYAALLAGAYVVLVVVIITSGLSAWLLLTLLTLPLAQRLIVTMAKHTDGPTLNGLLAGTGQLQLAFCVLLSAGLLLGR
jgi:1,4-dihydroxy-2-naphthoate octaprenyltransferase